VKSASHLLVGSGHVYLGPGKCDLGVSISVTPAGHGDKESTGKSWDQVPTAIRGMLGRLAREQDRRGRGRRLHIYGSHRKGVRPEAQGHGHRSWSLSLLQAFTAVVAVAVEWRP
jgi:hypothetical protein